MVEKYIEINIEDSDSYGMKVLSNVLDPVYETYTTMMIGKTKTQGALLEYSVVLLSQQLVKTYREIAKSRSVLKKVKEDFKLEIYL